MPQTKAGVNNSSWITYLRQCAKNYRAEQEAMRNGESDTQNSTDKKQMPKQTADTMDAKKAPKRRITGKQSPK